MARQIPGNTQVVPTVVFGPGRYSVGLATAMALAVNTFSPMSAGVRDGRRLGGSFYAGDPGYGVNRQGHDLGPIQQFHGAIQPIRAPLVRRLGFGAGVSGQPGL